MKKSILNEINEMKYLFNHQRGVVISEQPMTAEEKAAKIVKDGIDNKDTIRVYRGPKKEETKVQPNIPTQERQPAMNQNGVVVVKATGKHKFDKGEEVTLEIDGCKVNKSPKGVECHEVTVNGEQQIEDGKKAYYGNVYYTMNCGGVDMQARVYLPHSRINGCAAGKAV